MNDGKLSPFTAIYFSLAIVDTCVFGLGCHACLAAQGSKRFNFSTA